MADISTGKDTSFLDGIITGRVEPHIYAFSTETVPNYLKVGDTVRSVRVRLDEWRKIFPNLIKQYEHSAQIDEETIFRDYSVHVFLEKEKGKERLLPDTFRNLPYYSNEFFKETTAADLNEAILDIHQSAIEKDGKYQFYSPDRLPQTFTYKRTENFRPRANQQQVIDNFKTAIAAGRTNLLLYAVMRFGKSFTAMCCAKEMDAKFVAVVSAKADVKEEWKKTVESHVDFAGYKFLDSNALNRKETIIAETLATGDRVALFLTLQDLQGEEIKEKHKEVFEHQIDLLIIDETHFGARAASYGKVLQEQHIKKSEIKKELKSVDGFETLDQVEDAVKTLDAKVRIHLSGTPYRILMGDEFQKEDIIAFVQFTDIIDAQKQWDDEHQKEDGCNEWDNPYYGFPQMIRFAFNPNASSIKKMEELRKNGITHAFSELFRSQSMTSKADGCHRLLKHEAEVLDLLEVIDGTKEDENLLGFLDYDKIKEGKMCRHIVMVLPFRSSCDAMAALIRREQKQFKNLGEYEIINIAGFDDIRKYQSTDEVRRTIKDCEEKGRKTLTLTVNRMLTGTTVPQWDTMIFLKGTASPQEYDQAIFRLQNQYVTTFKDEDGNIIKYNMKPQTLLVDFDPDRMFRLQEMKSQLYNVNTEVQGNVQLKERIAKELSVSPIIVLNRNKLQEATPTDITDAVREYSRNRSIIDDATDIPADNVLLGDAEILKVIQRVAPINAKNGLQIKPLEGEGDDYDTPETLTGPGNDDDNNRIEQPSQQQETEDNKLAKRLAAYYARILFFAFLTESRVKSLEEVITAIPAAEDNQRITKNLGLDINILRAIQEKSNPFILQKFDYKIENTNDLIRDTALQPLERVEVAMRKFGRLSDSEIVTPAKVADEMVANLPSEETNNKEDAKYLDIASKQGEFSIALYKRFGETVKARLYAIPTSTLAYEFTRKIYTLLGMPVGNIFSDFTSYDLIDNNNEKIIKELKDMNFETIIGNPPYQETNIGNGNGSDPIYHLFIDVAKEFSKKTMFIHPARFLFNAGKTPKEWNTKMLNDSHFKVLNYWDKSDDVFNYVDIKGGIAVTQWDANAKTDPIVSFTPHKELYNILKKVVHHNMRSFSDIVYPRDLYKLNESIYIENPEIEGRHSKGHRYDLGSNVYKLYPEVFYSEKPNDNTTEYALIYGKKGNERELKWIKSSYLKLPDNFKSWKVFIPKANGAGILGEVLSTPIIGEPYMGHTLTFLSIGNFKTCEEATAVLKYIQTKFTRTLLGTLKVTQDNPKDTWANIPMQDFTTNSDIDWSKSIPEIDAQLYAKYKLSEDEISFIESMIKPM